MNWQLCPRCCPSNAPEQAVQETQHETITSHSRQHHILHQKFLQNHARPLVQWIELVHVIKQTKRKTQETKFSTGTLGKTRFKTHCSWVHSPILLGNCPRMMSARPCRVAALLMQTLRRCRPFGRPSAPTAGEFKAENGEIFETKLSNITKCSVFRDPTQNDTIEMLHGPGSSPSTSLSFFKGGPAWAKARPSCSTSALTLSSGRTSWFRGKHPLARACNSKFVSCCARRKLG